MTMQINLKSEANELLQDASKAIKGNKAIATLNIMPEVHEALDKLISMHCHSPYSIAKCSYLLGVYMGLKYNKFKIFNEGE
jgi:hypothetical protein